MKTELSMQLKEKCVGEKKSNGSEFPFSPLGQCDGMTLSSSTAVRRGSTPLPIKHQLRREEAVHEDCEWTAAGAAGPSASPIGLSPAVDDGLTAVSFEYRPEGPLRIALLGQNGVGKSSLAIALAGDMDRTASVDSEGSAAMWAGQECQAAFSVWGGGEGSPHSCWSLNTKIQFLKMQEADDNLPI